MTAMTAMTTITTVNEAPVVFSTHALCKVHRSGEVEVHALRDVEMEIRRSEFVVLVGASGSGKSTLLNILGGLNVPNSGEVRIGSAARIRSGVATGRQVIARPPATPRDGLWVVARKS